jgi:transcriptional regulator with PAS, ATPase and Fis domain
LGTCAERSPERRGTSAAFSRSRTCGTLFLDEIADMSPAMQTKFLRVLQDGEIRRVGGKSIIKVDVRVISATNKHIYEMVRKNEFREDLLYGST